MSVNKEEEREPLRKTQDTSYYDEEEMGFCHQCKQYKSVFVMARCKYDS